MVPESRTPLPTISRNINPLPQPISILVLGSSEGYSCATVANMRLESLARVNYCKRLIKRERLISDPDESNRAVGMMMQVHISYSARVFEIGPTTRFGYTFCTLLFKIA